MKITKIALLAILAMGSTQAFAQSPGPAAQVLNLALSGTVPVVCYFVIGANQSTTTLPPTTSVTLQFNAISEQLSTSMAVTCNDSAGYKITASSGNSGSLKNGVIASLAYTFAVDAAVGATAGSSLSSPAVVLTKSSGVETGNPHPLKIFYATNPSLNTQASGTYTDTILLSMQAQ